MDRDSLEKWLADGVSVERIAKRVGKNPSTVAYWMRKYGLVAPLREKYAGKGGVGQEELAALVAEGKTIADIAQVVGLSKTAVRHWLRRYGLRTLNKVGPRMGTVAREARAAGHAAIISNARGTESRSTCSKGGATTGASAAGASGSVTDAGV